MVVLHVFYGEDAVVVFCGEDSRVHATVVVFMAINGGRVSDRMHL